MKKWFRTLGIALGSSLGIRLLLALPVLALTVTFTAEIQVANTSATSYPKLPLIATNNNTLLADKGYITTNGTDVQITMGGNDYPRMLADNKTLFAAPVNAYSSTTYNYDTGNTPEDFDIITGYNGYLTTADFPAGEPTDNFSISLAGYFDTTSSMVSNNITEKDGAFRLYVSGTGNVTAALTRTYNYPNVSDNTSGVGTALTVPVSLPNGLASGDLLIVLIDLYDFAGAANPAITTPAGFTQLYHTAYGVKRFAAYYHSGNTTLTSPVNFTIDRNSFYSYRALRIPAGTWTSLPAAGVTATGAGSPPNPPNLAGFGANNVLYMAVSGSMDMPTGAPANYGGLLTQIANSACASWTYRELTAASDDPGAFTCVNTTWAANTIGVALPAPVTINNPEATPVTVPVASGEHTLTASGTANVQRWATGDVLEFDGTDDVVNCGSGATLDALTGNITVDAWIKPDTLGEGNIAFIYRKGSIRTNIQATNTVVFTITVGGLSKAVTAPANSITLGAWNHVVSVFNGSNVLLYINNILTTGDATAGPIDAHAANDLYIGDNDISTRCFDGLIGEVRVYNVAADAATIANRFAGDYSDRTGLVGEWYLDEGTGTNIPDYSGNANTGTLTNGAWTTSTYTSGLTGRLSDFTLSDGTVRYGKNLKGASVIDNANDWTWMSKATPYLTSANMTKDGSQLIYYQPQAIIMGTTLPNRLSGGLYPAVITWGSNPSGVTTTFSELVSDISATTSTTGVTTPNAVGTIGQGIPDIHKPNEDLTMPGHELYPIVNDIATISNIPIVMIWWFISAVCVFVIFGIARKYSNSIFLAGIAAVVVMGVFCVMGASATHPNSGGCLEWWQPAVVLLATICQVVLDRTTNM